MSEESKLGSVESEALTRETSAPVLREALLRRLPQRLRASAEYRVPPVPALLDSYVELFNAIWISIGRVFSEADLEQFRAGLKQNVDLAWAASPYSRVIVSFATDPPPQTSLSWRVDVETMSIADEYNHWVETRTPPLFGKHADAKIFEVARSLGDPSQVRILDVGAGTGRNTLPLARAGFPTDAVEMVPAFAAILREEAAKEALSVRIFEGNLFDPELGLPQGHYRILFLAEVVFHFRSLDQLRALLQLAVKLLPTNGLLVFSVFLNCEGYEPDQIARELAQVFWSTIVTRSELAEIAAGLPLELVSDEPVLGYEKEHLPADAWPPTGWFETWTGGQDLFQLPAGKPPIDLRWIVYRKLG